MGELPEYLDALERMPRTIDVAAQMPHHPLRVYVMGERGIKREAATPEDIDEMRAADRGGGQGRRVRVHDLAHLFAQDAMPANWFPAISPRKKSCSASAARSAPLEAALSA